MRVETRLIQKAQDTETHSTGSHGFAYSEARAWARLFSYKYLDRTLIGIMMMVFQRMVVVLMVSFIQAYLPARMEWHKRTAILRAHSHS